MAAKYKYWASTLTGGAEGSLDSIDGDDLNNLDTAQVDVADDKVYHYYLDDDSGLDENSPYVISPDSNAGDKRWILIPSHVISAIVMAVDLYGSSIISRAISDFVTTVTVVST